SVTVRYQAINEAGQWCGPLVTVQVPGQLALEEMTTQDEAEAPVMQTLPDGKVTLTFKDPNDLKSYFVSQNGQPEAATPNPSAGFDREALRGLAEGYRDLFKQQVDFIRDSRELTSARPAPAPTAAPAVTDAEAIRAQTENELLKHALSLSGDNPLALKVINGILGEKTSTDGPWWK